MKTLRIFSGVLAMALSCIGLARGQAAAPSPNLAGIAHVALRVTSLDASVAFFEKLGYVKAFALSRDGAVYEAFIKLNDRQFIELYPATAKDSQIGFLHLCFEGNDLKSVHDYYVAQGLKPTDVRTAGAGNLLFTMPGPASPTGPQNMEYTQYMPGSLHSKDFGQHLGDGRIADKMVEVTLAMQDPAAAKTFYLGKVGFKPEAGDLLGLPGDGPDSVKIVPAQPLGFKARIALQVADVGKAAKMLTERGVAFTKEPGRLVVMDPDGNEIDLTP